MKCDKCGRVVRDNGRESEQDCIYFHTIERCLSAQLASMTKRAEDAEAKWAKVEECLTKDSWAQINAKAAMYDAAEAKLATAAELADIVADEWLLDLEEPLDRFGMAHKIWRVWSKFRALGIDPSKEQGK